MTMTASGADEESDDDDSYGGGHLLSKTSGDHALDLRAHHHQKSTFRYAALLTCLSAMSAIFVWFTWLSFTSKDIRQVSRCRMAYMSPGYLRQDGMDKKHSNLAEKYSLWLYREQGWDLSNKPHGTPVLFAPGNAGSYKQVRSLAAEAARQYYERPGVPHAHLIEHHHQELDFFAADFNEDFSAFHAGTLTEQAEYLVDCLNYILKLYDDQGGTAPTSVVIIAHSMGGIAARYMLLQPKFIQDSIKTLITLSTPHTVPPATFDRGVQAIYTRINTFWRQSYSQEGSVLSDVLLVSIAGGTADTMVSSDYADISSLVPVTNGFSIMTTSVPALFSPVDHLAMMWCDQLRKQIVMALIQSTNSMSSSRRGPLKEALHVFRKHLAATNMVLQEDLVPSPALHTIALQDVVMHADSLSVLAAADKSSLHALSISSNSDVEVYIAATGVFDQLAFFRCTRSSLRYECQHLDRFTLGRIPLESDIGIAQFPWSRDSLLVIQANAHTMTSFSAGIVQPAKIVHATSIALLFSSWQYLVQGADNGSSLQTFHFPSLASSLLVYTVGLDYADTSCQSPMIPAVEIFTEAFEETHFVSGHNQNVRVHLHAFPPYVNGRSDATALQMRIWHDPECSLRVSLGIDVFASLSTLVIRFRSIVAAWPVFMALGVLCQQLSTSHGKPLTGTTAVQDFFLGSWSCWLAAMLSTGILQVMPVWGMATSPWVSQLLLGTAQALFLPLIPIFLAITAVLYLSSRGIFLSLFYLMTGILHTIQHSRDAKYRRSTGPWQRVAVFGALALFVATTAPHQFAFLVLTLVQFDNTLRSYIQQVEHNVEQTKQNFQINFSILLTMFWLLPQNGAILVVWLRNLQAGWWHPFPSDHSVLSIIGPLLLVDSLRVGKDTSLPQNRCIRLLLTSSMGIILLLGGRYVFIVGEVVNITFLILAVLQYHSVRRHL